MLPRTVVGLLSVALAVLPWQASQAQDRREAAGMDATFLQSRYPQARVIEVAAEDYPALEQRLRHAGYSPQQAAPVMQPTPPVPPPATPPTAPPPAPEHDRRSGDCGASSGQRAAGEGRIGVDVNIGTGGHSHGRGSGNEAVVIFVIVGAVVLVVWTLYAVKYVADRVRGVELCGERWSEWALATTSLNSDGPQYAYFTGLRYLGGVEQDGVAYGLSAELGQSDVLLAETRALRLQGLYWLLGPMLRWRLSAAANPSYFQMEFLAGSTDNKEMGVIAAAKLGFNFGLSDRLRLGISYGAMNLNLHEQGIILDRSRYYTLWGLDLGYRF